MCYIDNTNSQTKQSGVNKIGAGAVALVKLASNSVNSDKIVDGAIATADIR